MSDDGSRVRLDAFRKLTLERNLFTPPSGFTARLPLEPATLVREAWALFLGANTNPRLALYVHVPFCADRKCSFCMYHSQRWSSALEVDRYLDYLDGVSSFFADTFADRPFQSLYVGGGTPSLLSASQFSRLLDRVLGKFRFAPDAERTVEQSFQSCTEEKLDELRHLGINRVSFGLESVEPEVLAAVHRRSTSDDTVRRLVGHARRAGFTEVNVDLMIGLPQESADGIRRGFVLAAGAGAHSITVYLYRHQTATASALLDEYNREYLPRMLGVAREAAASVGLVDHVGSDDTEYQFFALPGHVDSYPLTGYLTRYDATESNSTLGLGRTAASFICDFFRAECRDPKDAFDSAAPTWAVEMVTSGRRRRLYVLESLNRNRAVSDREFRHLFGAGLLDVFPEEIGDLQSLGVAVFEDGQLRILAVNRLEFAALCKFFWDPEFLRELMKVGG